MDAVKTTNKKSRKKLIIILVVLGVIIAGICVACSVAVSSAKEQMEAAMSAMQTDVVSVRSLTKSVGATGKVISIQSKDITPSLSGVEIEEVLVEVGDEVREGEVLLRFDVEDISDELEDAKRQLAQTEQRNALNTADAQRGVEDAQRGVDYQTQVAATNMDSAYTAYINAFDDLDDLRQAEEDAWDAWYDAEQSYDELLEEIEKAEEEAEQNGEELDELLPEDSELTEDQRAELQELLEQLQIYFAGNTMQEAQAAVQQAAAAVKQAEAAYRQAEAAVSQMENTIETLYTNYETAVLNYENVVASGESTVASAKSGQQNVALTTDTDLQAEQVQLYEEQLEKGIVTAPFSGVITAVNVDPGDTYLQGAVLTLQDCSAYEIEAQIGEYDIPDIKRGQKVIIKTDATREQELEGKVVFVSPTATASVSAMTGMQTVDADPTYEIRISVQTPSDRLRLDMSANLSIIVQEEPAALTVPYNAVQLAEDGTYFVEVLNDDGETFTPVPVEIVMESNYYTQIKGALQEGQTVRIISQQTSDMFSIMSQMGAGGGF